MQVILLQLARFSLWLIQLIKDIDYLLFSTVMQMCDRNTQHDGYHTSLREINRKGT